MIDEGPSLDDMNRFGGDTGYCPECGEEIWDQAEVCPKCRAYLAGGLSSQPPPARDIQNKFVLIVTLIILLAFVLIYVL